MAPKVFSLGPDITVFDRAIDPRVFSKLINFVDKMEREYGRDDMLRVGSCPGSFWMPLSRKPQHPIEETVIAMKKVLNLGVKCIGAEWWFGFRPTTMGMKDHFDKDESTLTKTGRMYNPIKGSILYLDDVGLPTVIHSLRPKDLLTSKLKRDEPFTSTYVLPRANRCTLFRGDFLHGSADPSPAQKRREPSPRLRKFFAVNWWHRRPSEPWCLDIKPEWLAELPRFVLKIQKASGGHYDGSSFSIHPGQLT